MRRLYIFFLFPLISISQESFEYNEDGLTEYLVIVKDLSQENLYNKTKAWVMDTYNDPKEAIKNDVENEKIRIEGIKPQAYCMTTFCSSGRYGIEFSFKEGKYRIKPLFLNFENGAASSPVNFSDGSEYYKSNGKKRKIADRYFTAITSVFNELNSSLAAYLNSEDEDW